MAFVNLGDFGEDDFLGEVAAKLRLLLLRLRGIIYYTNICSKSRLLTLANRVVLSMVEYPIKKFSAFV